MELPVTDTGCENEEIREDSVIRSQTVQVSIGINWDGQRDVNL